MDKVTFILLLFCKFITPTQPNPPKYYTNLHSHHTRDNLHSLCTPIYNVDMYPVVNFRVALLNNVESSIHSDLPGF